MNKKQVISFNQAYSHEPTEQENQLINDMLAVWVKLEPAAAKAPATIRKGIIFGWGLAMAVNRGEITLPEVKAKTASKRIPGEP